MLYNKKPLISHLQLFGSLCYIHIPEERRSAGSKLQPRAERATFVGYTESPCIYKVQQLATKYMFAIQVTNCTFVPIKSTNSQSNQQLSIYSLPIHSLQSAVYSPAVYQFAVYQSSAYHSTLKFVQILHQFRRPSLAQI